MIWSEQDSIYVYQKSEKFACVPAPKRQEHFYPGVTQVCFLCFSQINYNHMGESPYLPSYFLGCLWNRVRITEMMNC